MSDQGSGGFPGDWPPIDSLDLDVHDLPHSSSTIEWWYVNAHFDDQHGRRWAAFAAFFRALLESREEDSPGRYAHSLVCGLVNTSDEQSWHTTRLDPRTPIEGLRSIEGNPGGDPRISQAFREVFEKNAVPLPDRLCSAEAVVADDALSLAYDGNRFEKLPHGAYRLELRLPEEGLYCDLVFDPEKKAVRHGDNGVVKGYTAETMFYYFIPRCRVSGTVTVENETLTLSSGSGWYDHEFGYRNRDNDSAGKEQDASVSWNWIAVQLSNGCDLTAYDIFDSSSEERCVGRWAIVVGPDGERHQHDRFSMKPTRWWTSARTFQKYPVEWRLEVPDADIWLVVASTPRDQEVPTVLAPPAFWESVADVSGTMKGSRVSGSAFVERTGFNDNASLEDYFRAVSRTIRDSLDRTLPLKPTSGQALDLVAGNDFRTSLDGLDIDKYVSTVIVPLRDILDRGGKAWRSYGSMLCFEIVGGDPNDYMDALLFPELIHTGSLIIDDIQDDSMLRRGGPACHSLHGVPVAINAGNAAYFLAENAIRGPAGRVWESLDNERKLRLYSLYFQAMRAGHAGQAMDLCGFEDHLRRAVESGDNTVLESRILAGHRLKSAIPASTVAKIGALAGGGDDVHVELLGRFFEDLGLAFQIIDDVINLRGFQDGLKTRGEDLTSRKVTMPLAKAMGLAPERVRRELVDRFSNLCVEDTDMAELIDLIESTGALDACVAQSRGLVEGAWQEIDQAFPESHSKIKLRVYSFYILQSYY